MHICIIHINRYIYTHTYIYIYILIFTHIYINLFIFSTYHVKPLNTTLKKKICKLSFVFLFTYFKMQDFLTDVSLFIVCMFEKQIDYSVFPYCVSQQKINTNLTEKNVNANISEVY